MEPHTHTQTHARTLARTRAGVRVSLCVCVCQIFVDKESNLIDILKNREYYIID